MVDYMKLFRRKPPVLNVLFLDRGSWNDPDPAFMTWYDKNPVGKMLHFWRDCPANLPISRKKEMLAHLGQCRSLLSRHRKTVSILEACEKQLAAAARICDTRSAATQETNE